MSKVVSFLCGVIFAAIVLFPFAVAFGWLVLQAAVKEADIRAAGTAMIGISRTDKACVTWQERNGAWYCTQR